MTDWKAELEPRSVAKKAARKAKGEQIKLGQTDEWAAKRTKKLTQRKLQEYDDARR